MQLEQRLSGSTYTVVRKFYDGLGRLVKTQTAGAALENGTRDIIVNTWYDAYGNVIEQSVPYDVSPGSGYRTPDTSRASTVKQYDVLGWLKKVIAPDGTSTTYTYLDLAVRLTDANGHSTVTRMDDWGRTVEVEPPAGPGVSYTYDEVDRLLSASRGGATVSLSYDLGGRKIAMNDPDLGNWTYTYDALGNLTSQTDARGCVIALSYDGLNRLTGKVFSGACDSTPDITYTYDAYTAGSNYGRGYRTGMTDASGSTSWKYDARGRVTEETKVVSGAGTFKTQWGYNSADLVAWLKYPADDAGGLGEQLTYTYHPQSWLNSASGTVTYVQSTVYDAAGRVQGRTLGNNLLVTDYTYFAWTTANGQGRLQRIVTSGTSTTFQDLRYTYDAMGNVLTIQDYYAGNPQTQTFAYDAADRLTTAVASGGSGGTYPSETYSYHGTSGNLSNKAGISYTYGDASHKHAVTSTSNGSSFSYDANGNMITRNVGGATYNLTYDAENHLVGVSGAATATFVYDGDGNRVKATINGTTIVYIGNYVEWNETTTSLTKYYYAGATRIAVRTAALRYLLTDHLGSTTVSLTGSGTYQSELRYKPWGETRYTDGSPPTRRQFTGQVNESALGLYFFNARWYDPVLRRFVQPDSLVPQPGNPLAWDRYSYCRNNPVRLVDPSGHWTEDELNEALGNDWLEKFFGDGSVFQGRDKLLEFLLSENTTDLITLGIVRLLFNVSSGVYGRGLDFSNIDAIGVRISGSGGGGGFTGGGADAILNITSGEFSIFGSVEGGFIAGDSVTVVGGMTLITKMPTNSGYRGTAKAVGGMGGDVIGVNIEGFSGGEHYFQDSSDVAHGLFVGVGGTIHPPNAGIYGSLSYAVEILNVNRAGYRFFPNYPGPIEAIYDVTVT